jgi:hypothetical protein
LQVKIGVPGIAVVAELQLKIPDKFPDEKRRAKSERSAM